MEALRAGPGPGDQESPGVGGGGGEEAGGEWGSIFIIRQPLGHEGVVFSL